MGIIIKFTKYTGNIFVVLLLSFFIIINVAGNTGSASVNYKSAVSFQLKNKDIFYNIGNNESIDDNKESDGISASARKEILNRARAMAEVKWSPKYNLIDKHAHYIFLKGKTYCGIPYSMGAYQTSSASDFLSKINNSSILYGNDCSGFLSSAWGLSRQTTLSLFNAVKNRKKIDGRRVTEISWNDLKPGDAILRDNGKGNGHVVLYINTDDGDSDKLYVYEQNIITRIPFEPIPTARKDVRYRSTLIKQGYIPIRLDL